MRCFLSEIYNNLTRAVLSCPEYPLNVPLHICETDSRKSTMSIMLELDESRRKKTICGSEINTYNFELFYHTIAQTDAQKRNIFDILSKISIYLEENYSKFKLNNISLLSCPKIIGKNGNGLDIFLTKFRVEVS